MQFSVSQQEISRQEEGRGRKPESYHDRMLRLLEEYGEFR